MHNLVHLAKFPAFFPDTRVAPSDTTAVRGSPARFAVTKTASALQGTTAWLHFAPQSRSVRCVALTDAFGGPRRIIESAVCMTSEGRVSEGQVTDDAPANSRPKDSLGTDREKILAFLSENSDLARTNKEFRTVTKKSEATVRRLVAPLLAEGRVERIGKGNQTKYRIKRKEQQPMAEHLLHISELCARLGVGKKTAKAVMAEHGVFPIPFGVGRGRGFRWLASAVDAAILQMYAQAQPKQNTSRQRKGTCTDLSTLDINQRYNLTHE